MWNNSEATLTRVLLPEQPRHRCRQSAPTCGGATVAADQRGIGGRQNGDNSGSAACDIGAFERRWVPLMGVTTTTDEFGEIMDRCSLREMIQAVNANADFGGCRKGTGNVSVPSGTYTLTRAGAVKTTTPRATWTSRRNINLVGCGKTATVINGIQGPDRPCDPGSQRNGDDEAT